MEGAEVGISTQAICLFEAGGVSGRGVVDLEVFENKFYSRYKFSRQFFLKKNIIPYPCPGVPIGPETVPLCFT